MISRKKVRHNGNFIKCIDNAKIEDPYWDYDIDDNERHFKCEISPLFAKCVRKGNKYLVYVSCDSPEEELGTIPADGSDKEVIYGIVEVEGGGYAKKGKKYFWNGYDLESEDGIIYDTVPYRYYFTEKDSILNKYKVELKF